jgi:PAS domain S-box-containing protein
MFTLSHNHIHSETMLNSLKNRLLAWFLSIALVIACIVFPLNYFHKKKERKIQNAVYTLYNLQYKFIEDLKHATEFLSYETTNPNFFITGESPYLNLHQELNDTLKHLFDKPSNIEINFSSGNQALIQQIKTNYTEYCEILDSIVYCIYLHGYRDFGLEGEMISYIHKAGENPKVSSSVNEIRRYEREYLNRNDAVFIPIVRDLTDKLITRLSMSNNYTLQEKTELIALLRNYKKSFDKLIALDYKLGLKSNTGLKNELNSTGDKLEQNVKIAINQAVQNEHRQIARLNLIFAILTALLFLSAIIISMYLSQHLVSYLEQLTNYISKIAENDFKYTEKLSLRKSSSEIRKIYMEFRNMAAQLKIKETQRDRALAIANENEKRFHNLADLLPQSIYETDRMGNLIYANKTWFKTFGYTADDIAQGLNLIEILISDTNTSLLGSIRIENSDYIAIRKDGSKFPASVYSDTILDDGKSIGKRGIIIDSTLRNKYVETLKKETIKAIASDKHKSFFLANMSHEIRTPMNSIIGFSNLLSAAQIPEKQKKDFIQHIQSSGQVLLNLIDDIIDIAKIEAGEIKIKPGTCEPVTIIKEICNTFEGYKASIGKNHLKIIQNLPNENVLFRTDPFRLRQILTNLISNAIKYTEEGSVVISLNVKNDRILEFSVEDTGIGLTKEELKDIFERFKRSKTSEIKNISGTGLGLAISKNLVELLGGQMWVSSIPVVGTKFWFEMPYAHVQHEKPTKLIPENIERSDHFDWFNRTILIAEDDDSSYTFLKQLLSKTNARLVRAINGKEVVEAVKFTEDIDIVLMDIQMPLLNGYDAAKQIKEFKPHLPIIAQTAFAMEGDKEKSILAGCDDYITKPIQPRQLLAKINQFLSHIEETGSSESEENSDQIFKNIKTKKNS